ncbi:MAG: tetratricopeptide repeat protein [Lysobacteraceae bacterium]|nr:MAG: tetratricopeptide repeat protein [Xanthomonadaceae bacterium]
MTPAPSVALPPAGHARLLGLCMMLLSGLASAATCPADISELIDSYARNRQFNGVVLVANDEQVLCRAAYGDANHDWATPNSTDARFRIGSLTKPFTATLVMQLVQEGTLRLDGRLGDLLPDLYGGTPAAAITIAQLLDHTSALRDVPGNYNDPWWQGPARQAYTPEAFARSWIPGELDGVPGAAFRYNNNGYFLLGLIIERATGSSYEDNMRRRILAPAGMRASGLYKAGLPVARLASGHATRPDGHRVPAAYLDPSVSWSAAGLYATVDDLYHFAQALRDDRLLDAAARRRMWTASPSGYGLGWWIEEWPIHGSGQARVMSHTGSIPGYQSYLLRSDQDGAFVALLDNDWRGELVTGMGRDLMEVLLGKPISLAKKSLADLLVPVAQTGGAEAMQAAYAAMGQTRDAYDRSEKAVNALGYRLLRLPQPAAAIVAFQWNVAAHPDSANTHDSLGEAYRAHGQVAEALASYRRALALDPGHASAAKAIKEMEAQAR